MAWNNKLLDDSNQQISNKGLFYGLPWLNALWNDVSGRNSQEREFAQQDYLLTREQDYVDERNRMDRLIEAGVNPNTAAQGVANSSASPVAPSVPSAANAPAAGLGALGNMLGNIGNIANSISEANERNTLLSLNKSSLQSSIQKMLVDIGFTELEAKGLSISLEYMDEKERLGIVTMSQNIDNLHKQYEVMQQSLEESKARIREIDKSIEDMGSRISLNDKLALESEKRRLLVEGETTEIQWFNNIRQQFGIDPSSAWQNNLFMRGVIYGPNDQLYLNGLNFVYDNNYKQMQAQYQADVDSAYNRTYNMLKAKADVDAAFAPFLKSLENEQLAFKQLLELYYTANGSIASVLHRAISTWLSDFNLNQDEIKSLLDEDVHSSKPPKAGVQ